MRLSALVLVAILGAAAMANAADDGWQLRSAGLKIPAETDSAATGGMTGSEAVYLRAAGHPSFGILERKIPLED